MFFLHLHVFPAPVINSQFAHDFSISEHGQKAHVLVLQSNLEIDETIQGGKRMNLSNRGASQLPFPRLHFTLGEGEF
jgi:hypothetical protein